MFAGYLVIGYWIFRYSGFYGINVGLDLAIVAAAMMGACAGFLWYNAAPAQIFMGDTGSLAIGTGLAALALSSSTALLLPILGLLFVIETTSVILQVPASACSAVASSRWRRSTTTSSSRAGPRPG